MAIIGWATLYPAAKPVLREVTPLMVAFDRAALAALALAAVTCLRKGSLAGGLRQLRDEAVVGGRRVAFLGLVSFAGTTLIAMTAQDYLPASINGLLNNLSPLWLALAAALLGRARSAPLLLAGSLLCVGGTALVLLGGQTQPAAQAAQVVQATQVAQAAQAAPAIPAAQGLRPTFVAGAALSLFGSGVIAYSTVLARRALAGRDPVALTAVAAGWGALPLLLALAAGANGSLAAFGDTTTSGRLLLLWLGTVSTAFNFALWYFALSHLPVTRVAPFSYLIAPLGVVLAVLLLHEPTGPWLYAGTVLIVAGIAVAQRGAEAAPAPPSSDVPLAEALTEAD